MSRIISVHSFRGGTGKSNTTANIAVLLAAEGRRVAVVDTDIQSPGIHVLFGIDQSQPGRYLNNYLWGDCAIEDAAHDVTARLGGELAGSLHLLPASIKPVDIARVMHDGYDVGLLNEGLHALIDRLDLDVLLLDTHPGLNEETLLSLAMSNAVAIVLRPDQQDYEGTSVTVSVARKLRVPHMLMVVNKTPSVFDVAEVQERVETAYDCEVAAVVPHSDELMVLSSGGIFALRYPDHPVTDLFGTLAARLMA
jgi:septum site-determining protein MinD